MMRMVGMDYYLASRGAGWAQYNGAAIFSTFIPGICFREGAYRFNPARS